jgi:Na+/proline symporter
MSNTVALIVLSIVGVVVVAFSLRSPEILAGNTFLQGFVNHEFMSLLGVILAITLASAAQLHLSLRQIEARHKNPDMLSGARRAVKNAAYGLIFLFVFGFVVVLLKPIFREEEVLVSIAHGAAIFIVAWTVLILISLTEAAFAANEILEDGKSRDD